ncbi:Na+/H+ antiporter NhaC [Priestia taiwanensis]|uniref:Na+/H+ antiporter NhaC n=1 Tax=Priestia taiwanensis TaxID=1347902 RepID=UPI0016659A9A|nr:Na+/H+ antiporter NhaC [Priestia taiwanensis]
MASKVESVVLLVFILGMIGYFIIGLKAPPHIPILFAFMVTLGFGFVKRVSWSVMDKGMREGISSGIVPIFIFILIGVLIGVWVASGTIPTMIVYGFEFVSRDFFLVTVFVVCAIVGTSIGSAFTTAATVGIAFIGMGGALGYDLAIVAGAIISGAFFGDKMSPLSDTTNLSPAVAGADMFEHIKNMMWTTIPAFVISFILFFIVGMNVSSETTVELTLFQDTLREYSIISPITLIGPLLLFVFAWRKIPAIPTLLVGILSGVILIFVFQPETTMQQLVSIMQDGVKSQTGVADVDALLTRGGIQSMMWSVSLILLSLGMGGLLIELGIIAQLVHAISSLVNTTGKLVLSTACTAMGINFILGEQYLSIILTGKAYAEKFQELDLHPKNLSRVLEDAGTVINPLVPWGVSGVFLTATLGVPTMEYLPFAFFCLLCPVITVILGFTGIGITKTR